MTRTLAGSSPLLTLLLVALAFFASASGAFGEEARPPNLIVVLTDDQGYGDWQRVNPAIHTPNLVKLADEGFVLESFHAMAACSPTRAALLTGRHGQRTGVVGLLNHLARDHRFMRLEEVTIAELLGNSGYRTGLIGKWHLSDRTDSAERYGFDYFYGFLRGSTSYVNPENLRRNKDELGVQEGYSTDLFADEAVSFIERNAERPFFLLFAPNAPHEVAVGKKEDLAHYASASLDDRERQTFATITSVDRALGRIRAAIEAQGLGRDTIVIFTSDNGSALSDKGKASLFWNATHVPFVAWAPGRIQKGSSNRLADVLDIYPTLVEWAGAKPPAGVTLDGKSLAPLLERGDETRLHLVLFREWNNSYAAFNNRYRLILERIPGGKLSPALFDRKHDPRETENTLTRRSASVLKLYRRLLAETLEWQRATREEPDWNPPPLVPISDLVESAASAGQ